MIIILRNYRSLIAFFLVVAFFALEFVAPTPLRPFYFWVARIGPVVGIAITIAALAYSFRK
jgi:hypothetical protein